MRERDLEQADAFFRNGEESAKDPLCWAAARNWFERCAQLRRKHLGEVAEIAQLLLKSARHWRIENQSMAFQKVLAVMQALPIFDKHGCRAEVADCYTEMGLAYLPSKGGLYRDAGQACEYYDNAVRLYRELNLESPQAVKANLGLARCYHEMRTGDCRHGYQTALDMSKRVHGTEHWETFLCARWLWTTFEVFHKGPYEDQMWECFPLKAEAQAAARWHVEALRPKAGDDAKRFPSQAQADRFEALLPRELMVQMWDPFFCIHMFSSARGCPAMENAMEMAEIDEGQRFVRAPSSTRVEPGKVTVSVGEWRDATDSIIFGG